MWSASTETRLRNCYVCFPATSIANGDQERKVLSLGLCIGLLHGHHFSEDSLSNVWYSASHSFQDTFKLAEEALDRSLSEAKICWPTLDQQRIWPFQVKLAKSKKNLPGHGVVADSAFPVSGECYGRIMTCLKENDVENASPEARHGLILVGTQITSARQAAQWGMGAVEKVYRRLLLALPFNHIRRGLKLRNIYRLYNYCVRTCGISHMNVSSPPEI